MCKTASAQRPWERPQLADGKTPENAVAERVVGQSAGAPRHRTGQSALRRILHVFFDGSLEKALTYHLADPATNLEPCPIPVSPSTDV